MTDSIRLLLSIDPKIIAQIDNVVKQVNATKETWRRHTNRQSVIKGLIRFAIDEDVEYVSGYGKHITVRHKK